MLSALVYQMERRKGLVTSGVHFMFWVISLAAGVFILSSKIMQLQRGVCTMLCIHIIFGVYLKQKYLWSNNVIRLLVHIKTCKTIRFGWRLSARWTISWRLSSTHFLVVFSFFEKTTYCCRARRPSVCPSVRLWK